MDTPVALVPALRDNYVALLHSPNGRNVAIIDPSEADPVKRFLEERDLQPVAIFNTHHHPDHVGGNRELQKAYDLPVYGAAEDRDRIPGLTHPMYDGDRVTPPGLDRVGILWDIPGHTRTHTAFLFPEDELVFAGDTLFVAGCGRLFEGSAEQMETSLSRLAGLPDSTQVYCGHEYTVKNLEFALAVEPDNGEIAEKLQWAREKRRKEEPTLPSTIGAEKRTNPFLRVREPAVREAAGGRGAADSDPVSVFAALRDWKDRF
ncbi:hydroxyacylglutathione hydrolase [Thiohalorhabdus methylotrophus]|uniref:Hydroxyacylglutathione hydrolase n=1 Tax=Thiohalorhabdus methylotrophus TaxID=3242694 RepID=A0ABV4TXE4_9GAMM